jgi:hypothetical protein
MAETSTAKSKSPAQQAEAKKVDEAQPAVASPLRRAYRRFMQLPRNFRLAALALLLFVAGAVLFTRLLSNPAKVTIVCQHGFRSAEVTVWADGDVIYSGTVNGSSKGRLGFLGSKSPGLYKTVDVPPGRHSIRVRLDADNESYDQTKIVSANFGEGGDNTVSISAGRHGLSVVAHGAPEATDDSGIVSSSRKLASSVMLSIFGSGMSAAIAFLVQEFLRAQKARLISPPTEVKS